MSARWRRRPRSVDRGAARPGLDPGHEVTCRMRMLFRVRKATRLGGVVDDARPRKVRRSCEAGERRRATVARAGGAGGGPGERAPGCARDTEPGRGERGTGARADGCKAPEEGAAHRAPAPCEH